MGYLSDFVYYNSGNEAPEQFWIWSALTLLSHIAGPKVVYKHGKFPISPNLYTGLIGTAGSGKTSSKSEVKHLVVEHFPYLHYSASIQSREDIAKKMGRPDCVVTWDGPADANGVPKINEYRPYFIIANEFESFLSVDPIRMVGFLVDIFDEKWFSTGFKKDADDLTGAQAFENPYVSILACGTPEWLMTELKMSLFKGGLGRRLILVCGESDKIVPDPFQPSDFQLYKDRVIDHLKWVENVQGVFERTEAGKKWWYEWYHKHKSEKPDDPILSQFASTKHVMLIKVAEALSLTEKSDKLLLDADHFAMALKLFDGLIPRITALTAGIGKNETAGFATQILEAVKAKGGAIFEKELKRIVYRHSPGADRAYLEALSFLEHTGAIVKAGVGLKDVEGKQVMDGGKPVVKVVIVTADAWEEYKRKHGI